MGEMATNGIPGSPAKKMRPDRSTAPAALGPPTFDLDTWASNYGGTGRSTTAHETKLSR